MANYSLFKSAPGLFDLAFGVPLAGRLKSTSNNDYTFSNWDGSVTIISGTDLVWDSALGQFTAGTIGGIRHLTGDGKTTIDRVTGLTLAVGDVNTIVAGAGYPPESLRLLAYSGDDLLDARGYSSTPSDGAFLVGYAGNDTIHGSGLGDEIFGGSGRDSISGNNGNDLINGGLDDDIIKGGNATDRLTGDGGADRLEGGGGNDFLFGGAGNDTYSGGDGTDYAVYTRSFYDLQITKTSSGFSVIEPNGQDTLGGVDRFAADEGVFLWVSWLRQFIQISTTPGALLLNPGTDIQGGSLADNITLDQPGKTIAFGKEGHDTITGAATYDLILGGSGNDRINGDPASGPAGGDRLYGEAGNDSIQGHGGGDLLYGGSGADTISGGNGHDTMTGGTGADVFHFEHGVIDGAAVTWGYDAINDFRVGEDHLSLSFVNAETVTPRLYYNGNGWVVALDGSGSIFLKGLHVSSLTLDDLLI